MLTLPRPASLETRKRPQTALSRELSATANDIGDFPMFDVAPGPYYASSGFTVPQPISVYRHSCAPR
jgi:hypothetical protein